MRFYQYHFVFFSSQKEYFFDKRLSIGGHLPVRNATNDVTQNQELHVLLFQDFYYKIALHVRGNYAIKSAEAE